MPARSFFAASLVAAFAFAAPAFAQTPLFDAHIHYSHDAWENLPPKAAIEVLRKAGIKRALVSSSIDEGQQRLVQEAPDLILPSLRPYRSRSDTSTWAKDATVKTYLDERLKKYRYVAVGEFHLFGADADLPVPRHMVELAKRHKLVLHAHSDVDAVERLFKQWPEAKILWAHSGFDSPDTVRGMLKKHKNLWADLAYRGDHAAGNKLAPEWRALFIEFPDRFMVGTDTFTPERWLFVGTHAQGVRAWLGDLPKDVAEKIASKNGEALFPMAK
jgi:hypothetical protein